MTESVNIFTNCIIQELTQSLLDYDVQLDIRISIITVNDEHIKLSKHFENLIGKQIGKYKIIIKKKSFNNNDTIKIYHEINMLEKKFRSMGCFVYTKEMEEDIILFSFAIEVNNLS